MFSKCTSINNISMESKTWSVMDYVLPLEEVSVYVTEDSCTPALQKKSNAFVRRFKMLLPCNFLMCLMAIHNSTSRL